MSKGKEGSEGEEKDNLLREKEPPTRKVGKDRTRIEVID